MWVLVGVVVIVEWSEVTEVCVPVIEEDLCLEVNDDGREKV